MGDEQLLWKFPVDACHHC